MNHPSEREDSPPAPGSILARAREAHNLSREDVATRLRLKSTVIASLENDDYEHLPLAAYTRGYIRNYARLLELTPDPLVAAYDRRMPGTPALDPTVTAPRQQTTSGDRSVRLVTFLVVGVLLALTIVWLQGEYLAEYQPAPGPAAPAASVATTKPATVPPLDWPLGYDYPVVQHQEPGAVVDVRDWAAPAVSQDVLPEDAGRAAVSPATAAMTLVLNEESWVEATDGTGRRLYYRLAPAGRRIALNGTFPFDVILGNAPGTTVMLGDRPMDIQPFTRGSVARFRIGTEGLSALPDRP